MRRSRNVVAPLLASAAVSLLAGCKHTEMQRCVDETGRVVNPSFCQNSPAATQPLYGGGYHGGGFHYYYGGSGTYTPGSLVSGGSSLPESGHSYSTTSGTTRGGFGSFFSGGGEGGEGAAHGGSAGE